MKQSFDPLDPPDRPSRNKGPVEVRPYDWIIARDEEPFTIVRPSNRQSTYSCCRCCCYCCCFCCRQCCCCRCCYCYTDVAAAAAIAAAAVAAVSGDGSTRMSSTVTERPSGRVRHYFSRKQRYLDQLQQRPIEVRRIHSTTISWMLFPLPHSFRIFYS